MLKKLFNWC